MLSHLDLCNYFFRKFNKITKPHLFYVKFPAYLKYVLEILISCLDLDLDLVSEISLRLPHILLISEVNSCLILIFQYLFRSLGPALQESELKIESRMPLRYPKMAKCIRKSAKMAVSTTLEAP